MHLSTTALIPILVTAVFIILAAFSRNEKHKFHDVDHIFSIGKAYVYTFLIMSILTPTIPFLLPIITGRVPTASDTRALIEAAAFLWSISVLSLVRSIKYRVIVGIESVKIGSFFIREIGYSNIAKVKYLGTIADGEYRIYPNSGKSVTVSSTLADFQGFVDEMQKRLPSNVVFVKKGSSKSQAR